MDSNEYLVFAVKKIQLVELICQPLNVAYFILLVLKVVNTLIHYQHLNYTSKSYFDALTAK